MINVTCEINGQKVNIKNRNAIEQAIINAAVSKGVDVVKSKLSAHEASQVTITVKGKSLDDLSLNISGPEEILEKIKSAL